MRRAAIYARYSSQSQRSESIEDQLLTCRRMAEVRGLLVLDPHIYVDRAQSGVRRDRIGLIGLLESASTGQFDVVLVDDLSRLARDNQLMQSVVAELCFHGVHVVSVADGLDSGDEDAMLAIQMRGVFNELLLTDLRQKTLRGQRGQKERGFFVAEVIFGYRSRPVGEVRLDRRGRYRPQGYTMEVEPGEARVVVRIFRDYAEGRTARQIARSLAREGAPSPVRARKGWLAGTVNGVLDNSKYAGRWVWNKTGTRRDPRTGRCRQVPKPESEWVVVEDESLRIISQALWDRVRGIRQSSKRAWRRRSGCSSAKT